MLQVAAVAPHLPQRRGAKILQPQRQIDSVARSSHPSPQSDPRLERKASQIHLLRGLANPLTGGLPVIGNRPVRLTPPMCRDRAPDQMEELRGPDRLGNWILQLAASPECEIVTH